MKLRITISNAIDELNRKVSHGEAHYQQAPYGHEDRCNSCQSYNARNDCEKVRAPISPLGWCELGVSILDGHEFNKD